MSQIQNSEILTNNSDPRIWKNILYEQNLNEVELNEFVMKYEHCQYEPSDFWYVLTSTQKIPIDFAIRYSNKVKWDCMMRHDQICEQDIMKLVQAQVIPQKISWIQIYANIKLSEEFMNMEEIKNNIDWIQISERTDLSFDFIFKNSDKMDWEIISYIYKFNPEQKALLEKYIHTESNLLYMEQNDILSQIKKLNEEIFAGQIKLIEDKYVFGYIGFNENTINCTKHKFNFENKTFEFNINLEETEMSFESKDFYHKLYPHPIFTTNPYGFLVFPTIRNLSKFYGIPDSCDLYPRHIAKVNIPLDSIGIGMTSQKYIAYRTKKIICVEIIE